MNRCNARVAAVRDHFQAHELVPPPPPLRRHSYHDSPDDYRWRPHDSGAMYASGVMNGLCAVAATSTSGGSVELDLCGVGKVDNMSMRETERERRRALFTRLHTGMAARVAAHRDTTTR